MSKNYAELVSKAWDNHVLFSLALELTYLCDLNCVMCYTNWDRKGDFLSTDNYSTLLKEARGLGCIYLTLTGGEPTLHKDFFTLGAMAAKEGYCIRIKTHGVYKNTDTLQRIIDEIDPLWIDISLHGADEETFEKTTGVSGSFSKLQRTLDFFHKKGVNVQLLTPVTTINQYKTQEIIDFARKYNFISRLDPQITVRDDGDKSSLDYSPDIDGLTDFFHVLKEKPDRENGDNNIFIDTESTDDNQAMLLSKYCCGAGTGSLTIGPYGDVYACTAWRNNLGNIKEQSIHSIWNNSSELLRIRNENEKAGTFRKKNENILKNALYCPGRAELEMGSASAIYDDVRKIITAQDNLKKNHKK